MDWSGRGDPAGRNRLTGRISAVLGSNPHCECEDAILQVLAPTCGPLSYRAVWPRISMASRNASPIRLKATTTSMIAIPGTMVKNGADRI